MGKRLWLAAVGALLLMASAARAEIDPSYNVVLLAENFPPYNVARNGKSFAQDDGIRGIVADVAREMFKRAGLSYSLTLRFPWDRVYNLALENSGHGVVVTARLPEREKLFKWAGPMGPLVVNNLQQAVQYRVGAYKGDTIAEFLEKQGMQPITSLRDQDNAKKLTAEQLDLWATGDPAGRYLALREVSVV